jgi:hypothetical protein
MRGNSYIINEQKIFCASFSLDYSEGVYLRSNLMDKDERLCLTLDSIELYARENTRTVKSLISDYHCSARSLITMENPECESTHLKKLNSLLQRSLISNDSLERYTENKELDISTFQSLANKAQNSLIELNRFIRDNDLNSEFDTDFSYHKYGWPIGIGGMIIGGLATYMEPSIPHDIKAIVPEDFIIPIITCASTVTSWTAGYLIMQLDYNNRVTNQITYITHNIDEIEKYIDMVGKMTSDPLAE